MTELILKQDIDDNKMKALLEFLKSWGIDVELKINSDRAVNVRKKKKEFSLSVGLWDDYQINSSELRSQAWERNKLF